jgi:GWxTD domain-containing protein
MKLFPGFIFVIFFLFGLGSCTQRLIPQQLNQGFEYQPATAVFHDLRREGDSLHVYLKFTDKNFFAFPQNITLSYAVYVNYGTNDKLLTDTISRKNTRFLKTEEAVFTDLKIPAAKLKDQAVLVVKVAARNDGENVFYKDIPLTSAAIAKSYVLIQPETGLPFFRNFLRKQEAFRVAQSGVAMPGELIRFETDYEAALPPMATQTKTVGKTLKKLQTISFLDQPLALPEPGLYSIEIGGKAAGGFLVESETFPEVTSAKELIQPLIYLTTSAERNKLYQAADPKLAVDNFWLNITPNQNEARTLIRVFYERVVTSNQLFTAHKAGWQTDRGMIYLIYGPADRVNRFNDREEWVYLANEDQALI